MESLRSGRAGAGEWIGVLSDQVVAVLPPQSADLAAQLWVAVDAGADFEEALDQVLRHGLAAVPSLVLAASGAEGALRLLVRGTPSVQVHLADGTTRVIASGAGVWREDVLGDVQGLEVELGAGVWPSEPAGPGLRRLGAWAAGTAALADSLADSVADSVAVADAPGAAQPVVLAASVDEVPTHGPDGAGEDELIWETAPLAAVPEWGDPAPATTGTPGPAASPAPGVGAATPRGVEAGWADDEQATDVIMSVEDAPTEVVVPGGAAHPPAPVPTRVQPVPRMPFPPGLTGCAAAILRPMNLSFRYLSREAVKLSHA